MTADSDQIVTAAVEAGMTEWLPWPSRANTPVRAVREDTRHALTVAVEHAMSAMRADHHRMSEDRTSRVNACITELEATNARLIDLLRAIEPSALYSLVNGISLPIDMQPWRERLLGAIDAARVALTAIETAE